MTACIVEDQKIAGIEADFRKLMKSAILELFVQVER